MIKNKKDDRITHGWDWNVFNDMIQQEAMEGVQSTSRSETAIDTTEAACESRNNTETEALEPCASTDDRSGIDLSWDSSPEQMEVSFFQKSPEQRHENLDVAMREVVDLIDARNIHQNSTCRRRIHAVQSSDEAHSRNYSLTSTDSQEELFVPFSDIGDRIPSVVNFQRQLPVRRRRNKKQHDPQEVRHQSVIQCTRERCSGEGQSSRCPAEFSTDTEGQYSGETIVVRRSSRNIERIDYRQYHETGRRIGGASRGDEEEDKMVAEL